MQGKSLDNLIISGQPTSQQLQEAWDVILEEYSTLVKTPKSENIFDVYKKIVKTQWSMLYLDQALDNLKEQYDEEIALKIMEMGYSLILPMDNRENYLRQIYLVETEAKTLIVLLNQYAAEYLRLCPPTDKEGFTPRTDMDYERELAMLSRYQGHKIKQYKISVFEYCAILNNFLEEKKPKSNG